MPTPPPEVGDVIPYVYLWRREFEAGEETGRKERPCVIVVATESGRVLVVPITTKHPGARASLPMPPRVKAALGLDQTPSWILCDEVNEFTWPGFDLGRTPDGRASYGRIPDRLIEEIRALILSLAQAHRLRRTSRDTPSTDG